MVLYLNLVLFLAFDDAGLEPARATVPFVPYSCAVRLSPLSARADSPRIFWRAP